MARVVQFKGKQYKVPEYTDWPSRPRTFNRSLYVYCYQCAQSFFCDPAIPPDLLQELETEHAITHIHEDVKRLEMEMP